MENPVKNLVFPSCFKVFQAQILQKYPRRSCGSFWSGLELWRPTFDRFRLIFPFFFHEFLCFSPQRRRPRQRLRPRLLRLNDDGDYDVDDGDDCGNLVASTTIAATWWLRPRQRLRPRLLRLNDDGDYDVGDGDDCGGHGHDC